MLPEGIYKRRHNHNNTPPSVLLILTNCVVMAVLVQMLTSCDKINNFFWAALAILALYNAYTIRKNREDYNRLNIIIYVASIIAMVLLFLYINNQPHNC